MKWKLLVIIILIATGVAGGVFLFLNKRKSNSNSAITVSSNQERSSAPMQVSIEDLLTKNASLKCTYNVQEAESKNTGVAYFSGGKKMYGEFTNVTKEGSKTAFVIRREDAQYVWQKGSQVGYKADVSAFTKEKQQQMQQQFDIGQNYKFDCENWKKDESKFVPPTDIIFSDISAQTEQLLQQLKNQ